MGCLLVGGCVGVMLCLPWGFWAEARGWAQPTTGRVDLPAGVAPGSLRLFASCLGVTTQAQPEADGTFKITPPYRDAFDLLASDWETWRDPYPLDGSPPEPEPTHAWEGELRGLPLGAQNARLTLTRRALVPASVRVLSTDGGAVAGALVRMESYSNMLSATTDATGVAHFRSVPPRVWRATARPPHDRTLGLLMGTTEFVPTDAPAGTTVDVRFRPGQPVRVQMADGLRVTSIECRAGGAYSGLPWEPDADGFMTLQVPLDATTLSVRAVHLKQLDERTTQESSVGAGAIAIREGTTLLVEPLAR